MLSSGLGEIAESAADDATRSARTPARHQSPFPQQQTKLPLRAAESHDDEPEVANAVISLFYAAGAHSDFISRVFERTKNRFQVNFWRGAASCSGCSRRLLSRMCICASILQQLSQACFCRSSVNFVHSLAIPVEFVDEKVSSCHIL